MKMRDRMKITQRLLVFGLTFLITITTCFLIRPVLADVPSIENIEPWTSGSDTILNITVRHSSPTFVHIVDLVSVDVDGNIQNVTLLSQDTVTFIVQFNMGEVLGTPTVSARARCTVHSWSSWSEPILIPEFTTVFLLFAVVSIPTIVLLLRSRVKRHSKQSD